MLDLLFHFGEGQNLYFNCPVKHDDITVFQPLNGEHNAYVFTNDDDFEILGVVVFSVHSFQKM